MHQAKTDVANAVVDIGADGEVSRVHVPTRAGEGNMKLPGQISEQEVTAALRLRARTIVAKQ